MTETKKTGNGKKRTTQQTLSTKTKKQRVTQKSYKQRAGTKQSTTGGGKTVDWMQDFGRHARPVGRRISRNGNIYYEYRQNRSDTEEELYAGTSTLDKKALKIQGQYGVVYHGGELVTPKDKRKTKKLSMQELLEVVKKYERKIHKRPVENLLYFDACGNVIAHCVGNGGSVYIDREMEDYAVINTHNHPYSSQKPAPQSDADVKNWLRYGNIARVCSYGVTYTYKKGSKYNPNKLSPLFITNLSGNLRHEFIRVQRELYEQIGKYLHIAIKTKTKNGRIYVEFANAFKLPEKLFSKAIVLARQMFEKRFGLEMVKVHKELAEDLRQAGIDVSFTVGGL